MGATCCKIVVQPGRIHAKKTQESFNNYLKNQNIDPATNNGTDEITPEVIESVERYGRQSAKELIRIMQID